MKKWIMRLAVLLAVGLICRCIPLAQWQILFQNTLRLSAVSILPRSYRLGQKDTPLVHTDTPATQSPVANTPDRAPTSSAAPVVTADPDLAIGKVIRKNLSPYTANTSHNKVYVSNKTGTTLNIASALEQEVGFTLVGDGRPEILLYHTHATECYLPESRDFYVEADATRSQDPQKNVLAVGEIIKEKLEAAGFGVLHDTTLHDASAYSGSYDRSEATVKKYLEAHPSIKIIIDLHRDSISSGENDKVAPITEINGRSAAQVMLCIASGTGGIANFENWQKNLPFALRLQQNLEQQNPGLARAALFLSQRYNQHLANAAILIEMGSEANSLQEALYAGELVGDTLAKLCTAVGAPSH